MKAFDRDFDAQWNPVDVDAQGWSTFNTETDDNLAVFLNNQDQVVILSSGEDHEVGWRLDVSQARTLANYLSHAVKVMNDRLIADITS